MRARLPPGPFPVSFRDVVGRKLTQAGTETGFIPEDLPPDEPRVRRLIEALETVGNGGGAWWRGLQGRGRRLAGPSSR